VIVSGGFDPDYQGVVRVAAKWRTSLEVT
jgi:hypothetical protein